MWEMKKISLKNLYLKFLQYICALIFKCCKGRQFFFSLYYRRKKPKIMKLERIFTLLMLTATTLTFAQQDSNPNYYVNDEPVDFKQTCIHPKQIDSLSVNERRNDGDVYIYTKNNEQGLTSSVEVENENQIQNEQVAYYINDNFNNTAGVNIDRKSIQDISLFKDESSVVSLEDETEPIIKIDLEEGKSQPIVKINSDREEEKPRYFK